MKTNELFLRIGELINATSVEDVLAQLGQWMTGFADTVENIEGPAGDVQCRNLRAAGMRLAHLASSFHANTTETMNGQPIFTSDDKGTLFVSIPAELAAPIPGGCQCDYCKAHPEETPKWDTLALPAKARNKQGEHTWTVHMPDKGGLAMFGWRKK